MGTSVRRANAMARPAILGLLLAGLLAQPAPAAQAPQRRAPIAEGRHRRPGARPPTGITPDRRLRRRPPHRRSHVRAGEPARPRLAGPARPGLPRGPGRSYLPLVSDFNGNGRSDVFWYGPGTATDVLWYGGSDGAFAGASAVNGTYEPFTGDFNGDRTDDVFWYGPGAGADVVWYGRAAGGFASRSVTVQGPASRWSPTSTATAARHPLVPGRPRQRRPLAGPRRRRVLQPVGLGRPQLPAAAGRLERRRPPRHPLVQARRRRRRALVRADRRALRRPIGHRERHLRPFTGDFNGDRRRDILWYGPGAGRDVAWYGRADGRFRPPR